MTQVLEYRPPLEDRPLTRLTTWLATPMSSRWRTAIVASSAAVLWGAAWLPGAALVEWAGWIGLIVCGLYGCVRKPLRWFVRRTHGLPNIRTPATESYGRWRMLLLLAAVTSPIYWWPLRVSLFVQGPLLDRFAWRVYAETPMDDPPATPRLVGLFVITGNRADPNGMRMRVLGAGGILDYCPTGPRSTNWLQRQTVPWFLAWNIPPKCGHWSVDSLHYKPYCG